MSISRAVTRLAEVQPDAVAVRRGATVLTRRALDRTTNRIARRWIDGGMEADDLVAIAIVDPVELVLAAVAVWKAGATPLPLGPGLDVDDRRAVLTAAGPGWLVEGSVDLSADCSDALLPDEWASSWLATVGGTADQPLIARSPRPARIDPDVPDDEDELVTQAASPPEVALLHAVRRSLGGDELVLTSV